MFLLISLSIILRAVHFRILVFLLAVVGDHALEAVILFAFYWINHVNDVFNFSKSDYTVD